MNSLDTYRFSYCLVIVFLLCSTLAVGQEQQKVSLQPKNEIRLDIFQLLILPGIDISYERFIDEVSSWGVSGFINFDRSFEEGYRYDDFEISPYYRLYFSMKKYKNKGFFVQPFISLIQSEFESYVIYDSPTNSYNKTLQEKKFFGFAGGALIGYKWLNIKNYSFEIHTGVGRYFLPANDDSFTGNTAYPRINFTIGRRF